MSHSSKRSQGRAQAKQFKTIWNSMPVPDVSTVISPIGFCKLGSQHCSSVGLPPRERHFVSRVPQHRGASPIFLCEMTCFSGIGGCHRLPTECGHFINLIIRTLTHVTYQQQKERDWLEEVRKESQFRGASRWYKKKSWRGGRREGVKLYLRKGVWVSSRLYKVITLFQRKLLLVWESWH